MPYITYNIIVQPDKINGNYWAWIGKLAKARGIQCPLIVCHADHITIASFGEGIETKVFDGKTHKTIQAAVNDNEKLMPGTDAPRWVVAPPSFVEKMKRGLENVWYIKEGKVYHVRVVDVQHENEGLQPYEQSAALPQQKSPNEAGAQSRHRLDELIERASRQIGI